MLKFLTHLYNFAEVYAVLFTWIVVPLGFYAGYLLMRDHLDFFDPSAVEQVPGANFKQGDRNASS